MIDQIFGMRGRAVRFKVRRRTNANHPLIRADARGDHPVADLIPVSHPRITLRGRQIGIAIVHVEFEINHRILLENGRQLGPEDRLNGVFRCRNAHRAFGGALAVVQRLQTIFDLFKAGGQGGEQILALKCRGNCPRGARQQAQAKPLL